MANKNAYFFTVKLSEVRTGEEVNYQLLQGVMQEIIENYGIEQQNYITLNLTLDDDPMHIIFDVFDYKNTRLFGRLSKQRPSNTMIQRDYRTYQKQDVLPDVSLDERGIEVYTYAYLDYETGILNIVYAKGAPDERVLKNLFLKYNTDYQIEIEAIPNARGIEQIYQGINSEIIRVEIEAGLPDAATLEHVFGWNNRELLDVINQRNLIVDFVLKPQPRRGITYDTEETINLIDCIKQALPRYKKAKVKAKARNVKARDYNLFEDYFSYPIEIPTYRTENYQRIQYSVDELVTIYKNNLIMAFNENRTLLLIATGRT